LLLQSLLLLLLLKSKAIVKTEDHIANLQVPI
jgi:hypothetical protein